MRTTTMVGWGGAAVAALLGVAACSGTSLHSVGDVNSGGASGSSTSDPTAGSTSLAGSNLVTPGGSGGVIGVVSPGGGGGIGDVGLPPDIAAGAGGEPNTGLQCPACTLVEAGDVRGVAANDQRVFWVEYGTKDALGNYAGDGRLHARDLSGGAKTVLADSLLGPESVSLSSKYAYVFLDQRNEPDHALGVARVPLAGGPLEPVQGLSPANWRTYRVFVSAAGYEYWSWGGAIYRIAETVGATFETIVQPRRAFLIGSDDVQLYFQDADGMWTVPLAGGTPTKLADAALGFLDLQLVSDGYMYAMETPARASETGTYLTRMPTAGGAWKRVVSSPNDLIWSQVAIDGDRYFIDEPTTLQRRLLQGSLASPGAEITLASQGFSGNESWAFNAWTLSSVGVFFADSTGLYVTPTASP